VRETLRRRAEAGREALAAAWPGEWTWRVLEASPDGRAVVEYAQGGQRVIGKLREDGGGEADAALLRELYGAGTRALRVPGVVDWLASEGVLLTEAAAGRPCRTLDPARERDTLGRIGAALRELHALPLRRGPAKRLADHVADLVRPSPAVLAEALPAHAARIHATLEALARAEASWGGTPVTLLHRDFHLRQLFDDGERVTVLDWDDAASGDPAFDVGYLTAYLRTHHGADAAEAGVAAFREGYGEDGDVWARVPVYERFNYLRRACRRFRLRDAGWETELEAMLARLEG